MGKPKFAPPQPKHANKYANQPPVSVINALETAVLILEQGGYDEPMIFGLVNCILKGFIRNGEWAPEYLEMVAKMQEEEKVNEEAQARIKALHETLGSATMTK